MPMSSAKHPPPSRSVVVDVLTRLWQTERNTIALFEQWLRETRDSDVYAGLTVQLADERRHLRLLADEIRALSGHPAGVGAEKASSRAFLEARTVHDDLRRICIVHKGIKAFTVDRCGHLLPIVEPRVARLLEQIARDQERHVQWAEIRFSRRLTRDERRQYGLLIERVEHMLALSWSKDWSLITARRFAL